MTRAIKPMACPRRSFRALERIFALSSVVVGFALAAPLARAQIDRTVPEANPDGLASDPAETPGAHVLSGPSSTGSFNSFEGLSAYFGLGTALDSSNGEPVDTFGNGVFYNPPQMAGIFESLGGDWVFFPHWGAGFRTSFRTQSDYAGLRYRPVFYDFHAIYEPLGYSRSLVPEFEAGLGGVNLRFYESEGCDAFAGCSGSSTYVGSSNHFQLRLSAGLRVYVVAGLFLRPQIDLHWVNNFFQFGRDWVPEYGMAVGYTFGRNP